MSKPPFGWDERGSFILQMVKGMKKRWLTIPLTTQ